MLVRTTRGISDKFVNELMSKVAFSDKFVNELMGKVAFNKKGQFKI
jgi:hypothetical protein